jgi:hypothetical protein
MHTEYVIVKPTQAPVPLMRRPNAHYWALVH